MSTDGNLCRCRWNKFCWSLSKTIYSRKSSAFQDSDSRLTGDGGRGSFWRRGDWMLLGWVTSLQTHFGALKAESWQNPNLIRFECLAYFPLDFAAFSICILMRALDRRKPIPWQQADEIWNKEVLRMLNYAEFTKIIFFAAMTDVKWNLKVTSRNCQLPWLSVSATVCTKQISTADEADDPITMRIWFQFTSPAGERCVHANQVQRVMLKNAPKAGCAIVFFARKIISRWIPTTRRTN